MFAEVIDLNFHFLSDQMGGAEHTKISASKIEGHLPISGET